MDPLKINPQHLDPIGSIQPMGVPPDIGEKETTPVNVPTQMKPSLQENVQSNKTVVSEGAKANSISNLVQVLTKESQGSDEIRKLSNKVSPLFGNLAKFAHAMGVNLKELEASLLPKRIPDTEKSKKLKGNITKFFEGNNPPTIKNLVAKAYFDHINTPEPFSKKNIQRLQMELKDILSGGTTNMNNVLKGTNKEFVTEWTESFIRNVGNMFTNRLYNDSAKQDIILSEINKFLELPPVE